MLTRSLHVHVVLLLILGLSFTGAAQADTFGVCVDLDKGEVRIGEWCGSCRPICGGPPAVEKVLRDALTEANAGSQLQADA